MMYLFAPPSRSSLCLSLGLLLLGLSHEVSSQTVYRIVGPDGKVTFSDRPPPDPKSTVTPTKQGKTTDGGTTGNGNTASFPPALQQAVNKYPVTLYTTKECSPCEAGRALLSKRGIPFTEKTVNTRDDIAAFKRINPDNSMPYLTIGGQAIKGYSEAEWDSYLDAADYPKQSVLPRNYQQGTAQAMVPLKTAAEAPAASASESNTPPARPNNTTPTTSPSNPAGIRF